MPTSPATLSGPNDTSSNPAGCHPITLALVMTQVLASNIMAQAHATLRHNDQALHWLERATSRPLIHYPFLSEHDRLLDNLRADDRFVRLLESVRARRERFEQDVASG